MQKRSKVSDLVSYYRARANEYEAVYAKPERQHDLGLLHQSVPEWFANRSVLEVACGTGYWTRRIALKAASITACDLAPETLDVARAQQPDANTVNFVLGNAFALQQVPGEFDAAFVGFFWSHILRDDIGNFLNGLHQRISVGGRVMILDNRYVEGSNSPIARTDAGGNTYQNRVLSDGTHHEVLKNFPSVDELHTTLSSAGALNIMVSTLPYFWAATYEIGAVAS